ncbi:MAG: TPM domain-containing protein, partial [Acidobacteriota bacterium]
DFWDKVVSRIGISFREGRFTEGIVAAIDDAGALLELHFPYERTDVDELPNEISFSEEPRDDE